MLALYLDWYNRERVHSRIEDRTPEQRSGTNSGELLVNMWKHQSIDTRSRSMNPVNKYSSYFSGTVLFLLGLGLALISGCGGGSSGSAVNDAGGSAKGLMVYTYQSNSYSGQSSGPSCKEPSCKPYTLDMKFSGWFAVAGALPVSSKTNLVNASSDSLSFMFDDGGYNTLDNFNKKNATVKEFWVTTDQDGNIVDCSIDLQSPRDVQAGGVFSNLKLWGPSSSDFRARAWNQLLCPMAVTGICNYDPVLADNPTFGGWALSVGGTWTKRVSVGPG
jgi:hypothetical protein